MLLPFVVCTLGFLILFPGKTGGHTTKKEKYLEYLTKYGYIRTERTRGLDLDSEIRDSVKRLQKFAGLKQNGDLSDPRTLALLERSRCGQSDIKHSNPLSRYALQGAKWKKENLSFKIVNYTPDLSKKQVDQTIDQAIAMWASTSSLTFTKITDPDKEADIMIKFVRGYHGDNRPSDGKGKELAHAFFPITNMKHAGDLHFDEDETYTVLNANDGVDLLWLAVHELGHSLGLDHSYHPDSVMFPFYMGYKAGLRLSDDDISGIRALYGKAIEPVTPSVRPSAPGKCHVMIDAMVTLADKNTFAFSGEYVWQIQDSGHNRAAGEARRIEDVFPKLEGSIDAAYTQRLQGHTIFFKGTKYWVYENQKYIWGPAEISDRKLPAELQNMDAALEWSRNNKAYFFKGDKYWRYNPAKNKIDPGYPKKIARAWRGVPPNGLDGALLWKNGQVYFFKGEKYFGFNDYRIRVRPGYPRSISADWFGCH